MLRAVGPSGDPGPVFYLVFECAPGIWDSRAYWSVGSANRRRLELEARGKLAFVEAR